MSPLSALPIRRGHQLAVSDQFVFREKGGLVLRADVLIVFASFLISPRGRPGCIMCSLSQNPLLRSSVPYPRIGHSVGKADTQEP